VAGARAAESFLIAQIADLKGLIAKTEAGHLVTSNRSAIRGMAGGSAPFSGVHAASRAPKPRRASAERLIPPRSPLSPGCGRAYVKGRAVSCRFDCPRTSTPPP
jgi:hypothetical protein